MKTNLHRPATILAALLLTSCCATMPGNSQEREIFVQAVGGVGFFGAGVVVVGYTSGTCVENRRNIRLENKKLQELLKRARNYNARIAAYNDNLRGKIDRLERKTRSQKAQMAKLKLAEAQREQQDVQGRANERSKLSKTLVPLQAKRYRETLRQLQKEERKLDKSIQWLRENYEPAQPG